MSKIVARLWGSSKESVGSSGFGGKASAGSLTNSRGQNRLTTAKGLDKRRQALIDMITQSPSRINEAPRHLVNSNKDPLGLGSSEQSMIKPKLMMGVSKGATAAIRTPGRTAPESILSPTKEFIKSAMAGNDLEEDIMDDSEQVQKAMRDVEAFAKYLGMDPLRDREYFWIAVEAMIAPLPPNWVEYFEGDQAYYHNSNTDHTQWEHPMDDYHRSLFKKHKEEAIQLQRMLGNRGAVEEEPSALSNIRGEAAVKAKVGSKAKKSSIVQPAKSEILGMEKLAGGGKAPKADGKMASFFVRKKHPLQDCTNCA